jgi:hypothetical protein
VRAKDLKHIPGSDVGADDFRYESAYSVSGEERDMKLTLTFNLRA